MKISTNIMDNQLRQKIQQKIQETLDNANEITNITKSLSYISENSYAFSYGIAIGRLYNSFYYQSRRILKRNPTSEEFSEFLEILKEHELDFKKKLGKN